MRKALGIGVTTALALGVLATVALLSESATVVLSIPAERLQSSLTLTGAPTGGDVPTQHMTVRVTDTLAGTASPATVGSTYASGMVVFTYYSACTRECGGISIRVPLGSDVSTAAGVHYVTLADEWFHGPDRPLPVATSQPTPVRALVPGAAGNAAAGTIVNFGYNQAPGLVVTNPNPITGGTDRQTHLVAQSDYDTVLRAVVTEANQDAANAMRVKAAGLGYAVAGPPVFAVKSSDLVGAETQTFTVTVTATLEAYAFHDTAVRANLKSAVLAQVRPYQQLTGDSIETDYRVVALASDGEVVIEATGTAFVIPRIDTANLQSHIAGMSFAQAAEELKADVPGARARIQVWPQGVRWLPMEPGNIAFRIETLPAPG